MTTDEFLAHLQALAAEKPVYRLGGDGDDGTCDCIGAIIGALRRGGVKWPGIHGSNWTARNATNNMSRIVKTSSLQTGDLVYKIHKPGSSGYDLPARYASHFDDKDYYHVGVVTQVNPLRILHCTAPGGFTTDRRLGQWTYHGQLSLLTQIVSVTNPDTVRYGSRGYAVTQLQLLLREQGYTLQPDGIFGPMTREAVRSYQTSQGLTADGIAGPLTWGSLLQRKED